MQLLSDCSPAVIGSRIKEQLPRTMANEEIHFGYISYSVIQIGLREFITYCLGSRPNFRSTLVIKSRNPIPPNIVTRF